MFIAASLVPGGAERVISELSNYFVNNGLAVSILLISGDVVKYDLHPDIKIISMYEDMKGRSGLWAMLRRKFLITQYVKHVNPDIIFSFLSDVNIYSCLALGLSKYKLIVSERNDPERDPASMLKRKIRDVVYKLADGYVFQTEAAKSYFPKSIQQKSTVIPNPIKAELPAPHRGEREKRIVAVGRLEPQKNYVLLLRAFAELHKGYPDYTLDIYGEGSQREYLLRTAKALGVTPRVNFNGVVHNVHDLIKSASLYVLTSDYEGMPNALMEAMAIGLPCVASDCPCGGPAMLIRDGENGLLFPVGDQKALVECMKKILGDKELALLISQNAIHIRNKYKLSSIAEQWMLFAEKNNTVELPGWVGYYEHYINIKKILKKIRYKIWNSPLFKRFLPSKIHVSIEYRALIGKKLNLKNPQSFNEKLQWLKLYDRKPEYIQMVDKYEVRKYISETIGSEYLTPLIGVYDNFDEIDFNSLPNQF
ncbi:MAG: glycosyltransferase, partial [Clostridia bacterium]|nr:glycosyltransferase [Clostridia bacterium]